MSVVGAGLIGCETAATLAARHAVTLVDMLARPLEPARARRREPAEEVLGALGRGFAGGSVHRPDRARGPGVTE